MKRLAAAILRYTSLRMMAASLRLHDPYIEAAERMAEDCETRRRLRREAEVFGPLRSIDNLDFSDTGKVKVRDVGALVRSPRVQAQVAAVREMAGTAK